MGSAITARSVPDLLAALDDNPMGVYETSDFATSLNLCIFTGWTDGLCALLDVLGQTAQGLQYIAVNGLNFALRLAEQNHALSSAHCEDCHAAHTIRLLLETGCRVSTSLLRIMNAPELNCIHGILLEHLRDRRQMLKEYALQHLTWTQSQDLQLHIPNRCVDVRAAEIIELLDKSAHRVPESLRTASLLLENDHRLSEAYITRGIWKQISYVHVATKLQSTAEDELSSTMESQIWQLLYGAGFTEIDEVGSEYEDHIGPPLTLCGHGDRARLGLWLLDKGADLSQEGSMRLPRWVPRQMKGVCFTYINTGTTAHQIARTFNPSQYNCEPRGHLPVGKWELLLIQRVLSADIAPDLCSCACSAGGCTPLTCLLSQWFRPGRYIPSKRFVRDSSWLWLWIQDAGRAAAMATIRALCFISLEMRHTCCHPAVQQGWDWNSAKEFWEEMDMIREEDSEVLQDFEGIVEELAQAFDQSGMGIAEFVLGPFWERVSRIQKEWKSKPLNVDACRSIGVCIENGPARPPGLAEGEVPLAIKYDWDRPQDRRLWLEKRLNDIFDESKPLMDIGEALREDGDCQVWREARECILNGLDKDNLYTRFERQWWW